VHGAAQEALKPDFLAKLVRICESETLPMLVGVIFILLGEMKRKIMINSMHVGLLF
jgi:hypothetical protein